MRVFRPLICIFVFLKCVNYFAEFGVCSAASSQPASRTSTHQPSSGSGGSSGNQTSSSGSGTNSSASITSNNQNNSSSTPSEHTATSRPPSSSVAISISVEYVVKEVNNNGFEVFVEDSAKPNDPEKCERKEIGGTRVDYEFKPNVKCTKVLFNGAEIWKHGDFDYAKNPETVSLTIYGKLTILFDSEHIDYSRNNEGSWTSGSPSIGILKKDNHPVWQPSGGGSNGTTPPANPSGGQDGSAKPAGGQGGTKPASPTSGSASAPKTGTQAGGTGTGQPRTGTAAQGGTAGSQAKSGNESPETKPADETAKTASSQPTSGESTQPDKSAEAKPAGQAGGQGSTAKPAGGSTATPAANQGGTEPAKPAGASSPSSGGITPASEGSTTPKSSGSSGMTGGRSTSNLTTNPSGGSVPTNNTGIALDIKKNKKDTPKFKHEKSGKVVTYTAKDDNKFTSVMYNGNTTIWTGDNANNYSKMVVLDGRGNNKKTVTIHLANDSKKVFKKDGKNKPWIEVIETNPNVVSGGMGAGN